MILIWSQNVLCYLLFLLFMASSGISEAQELVIKPSVAQMINDLNVQLDVYDLDKIVVRYDSVEQHNVKTHQFAGTMFHVVELPSSFHKCDSIDLISQVECLMRGKEQESYAQLGSNSSIAIIDFYKSTYLTAEESLALGMIESMCNVDLRVLTVQNNIVVKQKFFVCSFVFKDDGYSHLKITPLE